MHFGSMQRIAAAPGQGAKFVPENGAVVAWSPWWQRRLAEGSIVVVEAAEPKPVEAPKPAAKKEG